MTIKVTQRMIGRAHLESRQRKVGAITSNHRREVVEFAIKANTTPFGELTPEEQIRFNDLVAITNSFGVPA
jgi:hypothetical protein